MLRLITLGNTPNTDILVKGTQFVGILVRLETLAKRSSGDYSTSVVFSQRAVFRRGEMFPGLLVSGGR